MTTPELDAMPEVDSYLASLRVELDRVGVPESRMVDEARDHLRDAIEEGRRRGLTSSDAAREALARFGNAKMVARRCAATQNRALHRLLLATSIAIGLSIAFVDSRPHWDDSGITAAALLLSAGLLGAVGPRRPWVWALAVGVWIPLQAIRSAPGWHSATMFIVLLIPLLGSYLGMAARRVLQAGTPGARERRG